MAQADRAIGIGHSHFDQFLRVVRDPKVSIAAVAALAAAGAAVVNSREGSSVDAQTSEAPITRPQDPTITENQPQIVITKPEQSVSGPFQRGKKVDFELPTVDQGITKLSDLKGKPVILVFWATAWPHGGPKFIEEKVKPSVGDSVQFLSIAVASSPEDLQYRRGFGNSTIPQLLDPKAELLYRFDQSATFPAYVLIDPDGKYKAKKIGIPPDLAAWIKTNTSN